jgi:hypothetical protein
MTEPLDPEVVPIGLDVDDEMADDVVLALRRAADALPDADLDPAVPQRRHRIRQRRRRRLTGSAVAASAAAIVAAVALHVPIRDDGPDLAVTGEDPRQQSVKGEGGDVPLLLPEVHAVLMPGGEVRPWPRAEEGDTLRDSAARLPDGGLATLAERGSTLVLATFDRHGDLVDQHELGDHVEDVAIVGTWDDRIVVRRGESVTAVDPGTFDETDAIDLGEWVDVTAVGGDTLVAVTRVAGAGTVGECIVTAVDLRTGDESEAGRLSCLGLTAAAVSPGGDKAAVVIERRIGITANSGDILDQAVVVVDLDDGDDLGGYSFEAAAACQHGPAETCPGRLGLVQYRGLSWTGEQPELVVQDSDPLADDEGPGIATLDADQLRVITVTP